MIIIVCIIVLVCCGLVLLLAPADKLVKQENLKNGETFENAVKKMRKNGIGSLLLAAFAFLFYFVI